MQFLRQMLFVTISFVLRIPIWFVLWVMGKMGMIKTVFLIYPTDQSEVFDYSPNIGWLRRFFDGRPSPGGLIMDGFKPVGLYLMIPNSTMELMKKKNKYKVLTIIERMIWVREFLGADTIGLAGQLGPVFEKRHGVDMGHPFYSSTFGNIYSIRKAVEHTIKTSFALSHRKPENTKVAIVGGGLLGEQLRDSMSKEDGLDVPLVDVRYTRRGDILLKDPALAADQLSSVHIAINLLPRGEDFMNNHLSEMIPSMGVVIDFSRPPINPGSIPQDVEMGNRVTKKGFRFMIKLPGGWESNELPACCTPALLSSIVGIPLDSIEKYNLVAEQHQVKTSLI